ncbi:MAG: amidohydrolase family protein [Bauldia sp.]
MLIVDAQVHIWAANTPDRPWPPGVKAHRPTPFDVDELRREMDAAGVRRAILVPPFLEGDRNDLALSAATAEPDRFAVMGRFPVTSSKARRGELKTWLQQPGMLGIRLTFLRESERALIHDDAIDWLWEAAEEAAIPVMVYAPFGVKELDAIAGRHPRLRMIIDHLAFSRPARDAGKLFDHVPDVLAMAKRPNVAVKASALPAYSLEGYPFRDMHPTLQRAFDVFGPRRMFWGSDVTQLPCTYSQAISMFTEELPWLRGEDLDWVMGRGIQAWLGWPLPAVSNSR